MKLLERSFSMKKGIFSLLFLTLAMPVFSATPIEFTNGVVKEVYLGEMDPFVVGDACILTVRTSEGKVYGLVNTDDSCYEKSEELQALEGKSIAVSSSHLTTIDNKDAIKVLKEFDSEPFYLWWDGEVDLSFQQVKKINSKGLRRLEKLGKQMLNEEIGGDAANIPLFQGVKFPDTLSLKNVIYKLIYAAEYLENVTVSEVPGDD